jgi:hypothetical protein
MSKIKIQGNASGTGVLTIEAPNTSTDRTITLPDVTGTLLTTGGDGSSLTGITTGKVLQVVSVTKTSFFSTSSSTYVDVTGVSAAITPQSTTSKIYITISGAGTSSANSTFGYCVVLRGSTQIALGDSRGSAQRCSFDLGLPYSNPQDKGMAFSFSYLDSPSTTSAVTYKLQLKKTIGTVGIGGSYSTSDGNRSNSPTIITLMEIGA